MQNVNFQKVVTAGVAGTLAMTIVMLIGPMIGMPKMDMGIMLGTMNPMMELPYFLGWVMHFIIGTILTFIYAAFLFDKLPTEGWMKGAIYSIIPFLVMQMMLGPMMGMPFFSGGEIMAIIGSLLSHLAYGSVMGFVYGEG